MKALINLTDFHKAYDILAGSKYYYEIMNNINSYTRNIRNESSLNQFLNSYPFIKKHGENVKNVALMIGKELSLETKSLEIINKSSLYHDIAQVFFPSEIQGSFNPYNDSQIQALAAHPIISAELMGALYQSSDIYNTIILHHEALDGSGFPLKLKNAGIPLEAQVLRIADQYVSLTMEDHFFTPESKENIILDICTKMGEIYHEDIVIAFLRVIRKELKSNEVHFVDIDKKINDWRFRTYNLDNKLPISVVLIQKNLKVDSNVDLVSKVANMNTIEQKSII